MAGGHSQTQNDYNTNKTKYMVIKEEQIGVALRTSGKKLIQVICFDYLGKKLKNTER